MLGEGSHGCVFAHEKDPNLAVKKMRLCTSTHLSVEPMAETAALLRVKDCVVPNIVELVDFKVDSNNGHVELTMERLKPLNMAYTDEEVRKFVRQLYEAVAGSYYSSSLHLSSPRPSRTA